MFSFKLRYLCAFMAVLSAVLLCSCAFEKNNDVKKSEEETHQKEKIKIGFSMVGLIEERWQRDRDIFVAKAEELGSKVIVQNSYDESEQIYQVKLLLEQGIKVLVVTPHDSHHSDEIVKMARAAGVKVIAYDRLIRNGNVDMYISFDNVKIGELMAQSLMKVAPKGNYLLVNGSKSDYNSELIKQGYSSVLKERIDSGEIKIIDELWAEGWSRDLGLKFVERALKAGHKIDAVIAENDNLASAAIHALDNQKLAGCVPVTGQDAELGACQRIVQGTQFMTVYKPINALAQAAADLAVKMANNEAVDVKNTIFDGSTIVPYYKVQPVLVTKENMTNTVVNDGFHRADEIYKSSSNP